MDSRFPLLEGWLAVSDVAQCLKVSRQAVHKMLNSGIFNINDVRQIGSNIKPVYIIRETVVRELCRSRE